MGASIVVTYTKPTESCSSLLAAGWRLNRFNVTRAKDKPPRGLLRWIKGQPGTDYDWDSRDLFREYQDFVNNK